ncbi:membrane protein [Pimelobacter simplex]|nr:membrane protein [Pimelobacter simplex]
MAVLSGSLLAVSATNSEGTDLRPGRYTDLAGLVEGEAANYRTVEDRFNDLSDEVERLSAGVKDKSVDRARGEVAQLRDPAGMTPHAGPGLQITLSDAPEDLVDDAVERNKHVEPEKRLNLNRFVVHQQDIQAVVNALWNGGASAVTIAGQRVISTTGIKCEGNAVQLQGVPYPQPYVIEAVGDPSALYGSVSSDPIVSGYRTDSENPQIGIGWSLDLKERVEAPAYDGVVDLQYAKPLR